MKIVLAAAAVLLLAGGGTLAWRVARERSRPKHPPPPTTSQHGAGIDNQMSAVRAAYGAAAGANDCESAYNAFKASDDLGRSGQARAVVVRLAPRDQFLTLCAALSPGVQACLVPKYLAEHREQCRALRPTPEVISPMVQLTLPGQMAEPPEAPPVELSTPR